MKQERIDGRSSTNGEDRSADEVFAAEELESDVSNLEVQVTRIRQSDYSLESVRQFSKQNQLNCEED